MDRNCGTGPETQQTNAASVVCLTTCTPSVAFSDKLLRIRWLEKVPETQNTEGMGTLGFSAMAVHFHSP